MKRSTDTCNVDEPWKHYGQWKKPVTKDRAHFLDEAFHAKILPPLPVYKPIYNLILIPELPPQGYFSDKSSIK